jgi:hypothetical protein
MSKIVCLFEQSGTFKKVFKEMGDNAIDVDIKNDFGETNIQIDIFECLFTNTINTIITNDVVLVIAFFPCTWFSNQNKLIFNRTFKAFKKWDNERIDKYIRERKKEREKAKNAILKLIDFCNINNIPLIIENPRSEYIKKLLGEPTYYDVDRSKHGDILRKPTYYYCYGCNIANLKTIVQHRGIDVNHLSKVKRSMISEKYARNFIDHIIL